MSETVTLVTGKIIPMCRTLPDDENFYRIYDDFITQVYERFNGVINKKKTKKLVIPDISMCDRDVFTQGEYFEDSKTVQIYSANTIKAYFDMSEKLIYTTLLFNVLHELKHSDYKGDLKKYLTSMEYNDRLEMLVNYNTYKFIYENINEVKKLYSEIDSIHYYIQMKELKKINKGFKKPIDFKKGIW